MKHEHQWECCNAQWMRCNRCGQERNTMEGTITLDDPNDPTSGLWVMSIGETANFSQLLVPFLDRRVRITVETIDA